MDLLRGSRHGSGRRRSGQVPQPVPLPAAALLLLLLAGCSGGAESKPQAARQGPPPVPVTAAEAARKDFPVTLSAVGTAEAYDTVAVKSLVDGQLTKAGFVEGQDVRKGQLLFEIDPRPYEAALKAAEATLAKERALKTNAEKDRERYAMLIARDLVPKQQYDQVVANAAALEATVAAAAAAVENSRLQLSYCFIRSPIDGRTGDLAVNPGNVVEANETVLVTINRIVPIHVSFAVPEQRLPEIRRYEAAGELSLEAAPPGDDRPERGTLVFIGNAVDNATGTIRLKGKFANASKRLWPGQFVTVSLTLTTRAGAVVVPSQAVQTGQDGPFVFVVKADNTVEQRPVTAGESADGETVIEKGVGPGERVVTDGQLRLVPGARVALPRGASG